MFIGADLHEIHKPVTGLAIHQQQADDWVKEGDNRIMRLTAAKEPNLQSPLWADIILPPPHSFCEHQSPLTTGARWSPYLRGVLDLASVSR
jgi:hypothetical protein